jgi:hypothetical protein
MTAAILRDFKSHSHKIFPISGLKCSRIAKGLLQMPGQRANGAVVAAEEESIRFQESSLWLVACRAELRPPVNTR